MKHRIILASASKRRSRILKECGIPHKVAVSNVSEKMDHEKGARFNVLHNARLKAEKVAAKYKKGFVIGVDTVVLLGKRLIGKPKTKKEAKSILSAFSGKTILVYTGLFIIDIEREKSREAVDISKVHVKKLSRKEINKFVKIENSVVYPHDQNLARQFRAVE